MRKLIVMIAVASAAAFLGGCAGGSMLPGTTQSTMTRTDIVGGPPAAQHSVHALDIVGGPPATRHRAHALDIVGGPPAVGPLDIVGGPPGKSK